jgi:hypothetical protein
MPLTGIRFADSSGRYAQYTLAPAFAGKTLLQIVTQCVITRANTGSAAWKAGLCSNVGTLQSKALATASTTLRIGVGDGSADRFDWALFMVKPGNGHGDFQGRHIWAFGSEQRTNTAANGPVEIVGIPQGTPDCTDFAVWLNNGTPEMYSGGAFAPICGYWFWDDNNGASSFCQELGYTGGTLTKTRGKYFVKSVFVQRCASPSEPSLQSCTEGGWFPSGTMNAAKGADSCNAGQPVSITMTCTGTSTKASTC